MWNMYISQIDLIVYYGNIACILGIRNHKYVLKPQPGEYIYLRFTQTFEKVECNFNMYLFPIISRMLGAARLNTNKNINIIYGKNI